MAAVHYHRDRFPPEERLDWHGLAPMIGPASAALARYDGMLAAIPNPQVLLSPLTTREAVLSSRIEGTQATMGEVLRFEAGQTPAKAERHEDIQEVLNYRLAVRHAERMLASLPLCQRVLLETHEVLLSGARGRGRAPGAYRRVQNWIGPADCAIEEARFVPVDAHELPERMSAWERHIHAETPDKLVQLAVLHAEFEALHPFLDGNGRLGRLMVPLFLWQAGLIRAPMFYASAYLELHREAYYERLLAVSRDDDWTGWCLFFLDAIKVQAEDHLAKVQGMIDLYNEMKTRVVDLTHSQYAIHALDWIFERPIFRSTDFVAHGAVPDPTARRILKVLREGGILKPLREGRGRQAAILAFPRLLNIAEEEEVF